MKDKNLKDNDDDEAFEIMKEDDEELSDEGQEFEGQFMVLSLKVLSPMMVNGL